MKIPLLVSALMTLLFATQLYASNPTKVITFKAYTDNNVLSSDLIVAERYPGTCIAHSFANPGRMDAWRCRASNMVLDPCYEDDNSLACIVSPWTHKVAILELNVPINPHSSKKVDMHHLPWALELEGGQRCTYLSGTSLAIDKLRINYGCEGYKYYVIGGIDRSSQTWTVNVYNFENRTVSKVPISTAWY
jgi:hypothetical protein